MSLIEKKKEIAAPNLLQLNASGGMISLGSLGRSIKNHYSKSGFSFVFRFPEERCEIATCPIHTARLSEAVLTELSSISCDKSITISYLNVKRGNHLLCHRIIFLIKARECAKRRLESMIAGTELRLISFAENLACATGIEIAPPVTKCSNRQVEVTIELSAENIYRAYSSQTLELYLSLTFREQEIVEHLRRGLDIAGISQTLGITVATVKQHLKNIYEKTEVKNRWQLLKLFGGNHPPLIR